MIKKKDAGGFQTEEHVIARATIRKLKNRTKAFDNNDNLKAIGEL